MEDCDKNLVTIWMSIGGVKHQFEHPQSPTDEMLTLGSVAAAGHLLDGREWNEFPKVEGKK